MRDNVTFQKDLNLTFSLSCGAEKKDNRHIQYFDWEKLCQKCQRRRNGQIISHSSLCIKLSF